MTRSAFGGETADASWRMLVLKICVFLLGVLSTAGAAANPLNARDFKIAGDKQYTRVVIQFDRSPEMEWFLLKGPHRIVIDLPDTAFAFDPRDLEARGLISAVKYGKMSQTRSRLVFEAVGPFSVARVEALKNETSEGYRLLVELRSATLEAFDAELSKRFAPTPSSLSSAETEVTEAEPVGETPLVVALDAGHGGADGGARGINGTVEKTITLVFALELEKKLKQTGRYKVVLTRRKDRFLRLDERVRIAREKGANLFVSIHADAISSRAVRGATVYTVSDKASDAEAAATAARENLSDAIAGHVVEEEQDEVEDILVDLIRRETHAFSIRLARNLIGSLSKTVELVKNPHRYAGFQVLKAPDIPSVLLELGYLSNPRDEAQMRDPEWRSETAEAIVSAIDVFARAGSRKPLEKRAVGE